MIHFETIKLTNANEFIDSKEKKLQKKLWALNTLKRKWSRLGLQNYMTQQEKFPNRRWNKKKINRTTNNITTSRLYIEEKTQKKK